MMSNTRLALGRRQTTERGMGWARRAVQTAPQPVPFPDTSGGNSKQ